MKSKYNTIAFGFFAIFFTFFAASASQAAVLKISPKGEQLMFDKTAFTVKAGEKVKLTFTNTSGMQHNWVLVAPGSADKVAQESITAGAAKGWLAVGPNVLAHTNLVDPKKSDTVEFVAPTKPGDYPFICSFPGHAMTMKGILTVK